MSQERSAEFLRGAVESHINTCNLITSITSAEKSHPARQGLMAAGNELHNQLDRYRTLLAAAEAREAGERYHTWGLKSEFMPNPVCLVCGAVAGDGVNNSPCAHPTADEVIAAAEKALERAQGYPLSYESVHAEAYGANQLIPSAKRAISEAEDSMREALTLIARYKEANGGKP